jgi:hypothetical protein
MSSAGGRQIKVLLVLLLREGKVTVYASELMVRASVGHEEKNCQQYQQWDVPFAQDTTAILNVGHPRSLHSHRRYYNSARSLSALVTVDIKINHTRAKNFNLRSDFLNDIQEIARCGLP